MRPHALGVAMSSVADCGVIEFAGTACQAPYIVVDSNGFSAERNDEATIMTGGGDNKNVLIDRVVKTMIMRMGIKPPRLVISVCGEQNAIVPPENLERVLMNGLAETNDLWVVTSGLNQGVSAMVAQLVTDIRASNTDIGEFAIPVIGIMPFGVVKFQELLTTPPETTAKNAWQGISNNKVAAQAAKQYQVAQTKWANAFSENNFKGKEGQVADNVAAAIKEFGAERYSEPRDKAPVVEYPDPKKARTGNQQDLDEARKCSRITYPVHMVKDIDRNHTHFIFIKDFEKPDLDNAAKRIAGVWHDHSEGETEEDWNTRIWEDALMVRDTFEDYLKGTSFVELLHDYKEGRNDAMYGNTNERKKSVSGFEVFEDTVPQNSVLDNASRVHTLQVVVGGADPESALTTLKIVETAVQDFVTLSPIVVIEGSGGIADILAYAWRMLNDPSPVYTGLNRVSLEAQVRKTFHLVRAADSSKIITRICNTVAVARKVVPFHLATSDGSDLDKAMLRALLPNIPSKRMKTGVTKNSSTDAKPEFRLRDMYLQSLDMLRIAMAFDRVKEVRDLLQRARVAWNDLKAYPDAMASDKDLFEFYEFYGYEKLEFKDQVALALEWALIEGKLEMVKEILQQLEIESDLFQFLYGRSVNLKTQNGHSLHQLYFGDEDSERSHPCFQAEKSPRGGKTDRGYLAQIFRKQKKNSWCAKRNKGRKGLAKETNDANDANELLQNVWSLVKRLTFDLDKCNDRTYELDEFFDTDQVSQMSEEDKLLVANQELMLWAALMNRYDLAEFFWQNGGNALANALICSRVCIGLAATAQLSEPKFEETKHEFEEMSAQFEKLAIQCMTRCYSVDGTLTQKVVTAPLTAFDWLRYPENESPDCLKLASLAKNQDFLSHAACQTVIAKQWSAESAKFYNDPRKFFTAPRTRFVMDAVAYILFLMLYTSISLQAATDRFTNWEYVLLGWVSTMVFEEFRQTTQEGVNYQALREWANIWNYQDAAMYVVYFIGLGVRQAALNADEGDGRRSLMVTAKVVFGLNLMQAYIRSLQFFKVFEGLGVKIEIFLSLFSELFEILLLMFVFILAYGLYIQSVLHPFADITTGHSFLHTFYRVVYRPYFQIYGELMLDDLAEDTSCIGGTLPFTSCASWTEYTIPVVTGLYLILNTFMLLNMLIASFTNTYQSILDESIKVYRLGMYKILDDYDDRTYLPMPFGVPESIFEFSRKMFGLAKKTCCAQSESIDEADEIDNIDEKLQVEKFQDIHADALIEEIRHARAVSVSVQVSQLEFKLNDALQELRLSRGRAAAQNAREEKRADQSASADAAQQGDAFDGVVERLDGLKKKKLAWATRINGEENRLKVPAEKLKKDGVELFKGKDKTTRFKKKGENHFLLHIVTRWKRDANGIKIVREGTYVLEMVAIKKGRADDFWAIPEQLKDVPEGIKDPGSPAVRCAAGLPVHVRVHLRTRPQLCLPAASPRCAACVAGFNPVTPTRARALARGRVGSRAGAFALRSSIVVRPLVAPGWPDLIPHMCHGAAGAAAFH